jgi:hypothetical protein
MPPLLGFVLWRIVNGAMKRALRLVGCCVLCGTASLAARADNAPAKAPKIPAATDPSTGAVIAGPLGPLQKPVTAPATPLAAPTVPAPVTLDTIDFSSPADITTTDPEEIANRTLAMSQQGHENSEALQEQAELEQQQDEQQHDWMLRGYQEQLRKQGLSKTKDENADPYGILPPKTTGDAATDLANDPLLSSVKLPGSADDTDAAGNPERRKNPFLDPEKKLQPSDSLLPTYLPPLLAPINSPNNPSSPTHDYFGGTSPDVANTPDSGLIEQPAAMPISDSSILDVPGLTAAKQGGLEDSDLNVDDRLPDEPANRTTTRPDVNNFALPTAPTNDIDTFYKKQTASLQPPTAPTFLPPPQLTLPKTYQPPPRIAKPAIDGLRNHIADPFDYLNR